MPTLTYHDSDGIDKVYELGTEPVVIGRATECEIQTQDAKVSRRHARIFFADDAYWIEDLRSSNGVYVGVDKVKKSQIKPGDVISCGSLVLEWKEDARKRKAAERAAEKAAAERAAAKAAEKAAERAAAVAEAVLAHGRRPTSTGDAPVIPPPPGPNLGAKLEDEKRLRLEAEAALKAALERAAAAEMRLTEYDADMKRNEEEAARLATQIDSLTAELLRIRETPPDTTELDRERAARNQAETQVTQLRERVAIIEADLELDRGARSALEDEKQHLEEHNQRLRDERRQLELERDEQKQEIARLVEIEKQAGQTRAALAKLETEHQGLTERAEQMASALVQAEDDARRVANQSAEQLAQLEADKRSLSEKLADVSELEMARRTLEEKLASLGRVAVANLALEEKMQQQASALEALQTELAGARTAHEHELATAHDEQRTRGESMAQLERKLAEVEEEARLGAKQQAAQLATVESVKQLLEKEVERLTAVETEKQALEEELRRVAAVETEKRALEEQLSAATSTKRALEDRLAGMGDLEATNQAMEERLRELTETEGRRQELTDRAQQLAAELEQARAEAGRIDDERAARRAAQEECEQLRERISTLEKDLERTLSAPAASEIEKQALEAKVELLTSEIEQLKLAPAAAGPLDPAAGEAATALADTVAELRSSLRAASDEAASLSEPQHSIQVIGDSLTQATEQLETLRGNLRALNKLLGLEE